MQELRMKQASDVKLQDIRRRVESGSVTMSRSFSSGETKYIRRNGLIYRLFKKNAKVSFQLVVPSSLTHSVMNLAHGKSCRQKGNYKSDLKRILLACAPASNLGYLAPPQDNF